MRQRIILTTSLIFCLVSVISLTEELRLVNVAPYMDVDVDTAYDMITNGSYRDLVVLDVARVEYS